MKCKDAVILNPMCCTIFSNAVEVMQIMQENGVEVVPVIDETTQILLGIVTEQDLFLSQLEGADFRELTAGECMSPIPAVCFLDDDIQAAENLMSQHHLRHIPVIDYEGHCVGLLAQEAILQNITH